MNPKALQHFIKNEYLNISPNGFITLKELNIQDDITITVCNLPNEFFHWADVDYQYLTTNSSGFDGLQHGFLFYTPALMCQILNDAAERLNSTALMYWVFRLTAENLKNNLDNLLQLFNEKLLFLLNIFLEYLDQNDVSIRDDITEVIAKIDRLILHKPNEN